MITIRILETFDKLKDHLNDGERGGFTSTWERFYEGQVLNVLSITPWYDGYEVMLDETRRVVLRDHQFARVE